MERHRLWEENHKKKACNSVKRYNIKNKEKVIKRIRTWQEKNKDKIKKERKEYYKLNKEKFKIYHKEYIKTPPGRLSYKKQNHKRHREMEFESLNLYFKDSEGHHLDFKNVINIPKELHRSISHKQSDENSMKNINMLAWSFMESQIY